MESNNPFTRNVTETTTYGTLQLNVLLPPPYYRKIWYYKKAVNESIQKAILNFDWFKAFRNKNANENCKLLTDTIMNIFRNYIPHKKNSTSRPLIRWTHWSSLR